MSAFEFLILGLYFLTLVILAIMGFHRYVMVWLYFKHKDRKAAPAPLPERLPRVTVQLPIFNEMYVVERLLDSVAAIRYPKDLLEIQVLDDSTDETTAIASRAPSSAIAPRASTSTTSTATDRTGYKAGALDAGLESAKGEFVLIFDADFVAAARHPREDASTTSPTRRSAMVQARWGHINRDYSLLTEVQSIMLDGHFIIEHGARSRGGPLLQLQRHGRHLAARGDRRRGRLAARHADRGPRPLLPRAAAGLAVRLPARPRRARRAARRDERVQDAAVPLGQGLRAGLQEAPAAHPRVASCPGGRRSRRSSTSPPTSPIPLMLLLSALMFPAMVLRYSMGWAEMFVVDVPIFLAATASVCAFYAISQKEQFPTTWKSKLKYIPAVLGIGMGISINNAIAVLEGLFGKQSEFTRTPKYRIEGAGDDWKTKIYKGKSSWVPYAELGARLLLHLRQPLRAHLRPGRHAPLHRALPVGLPLHLRHVARTEPRLARAATAGSLIAPRRT